jgi:hypothetical protein
MNEVLKGFLFSLLSVFSTILSACIIALIRWKIEDISVRVKDEKKRRFLDWVANDLIVKCINTTAQTYVNDLKEANSFNKEAQEKALKDTVNSVTQLLTDTNKDLLNNYVGDVETWITTCVESHITESKK